MPLNSIQTIKKFYNKKDALKAASYFKSQYKTLGQKVTIEIIEAYKVHGSIKRSIGSPRPDDYIIFIKHQTTPVIKKVVQKIKTTITKAKAIISKVLKPHITMRPKPIMIIATPNYHKIIKVKSTYVPQQFTIIAPFSLYKRHTA